MDGQDVIKAFNQIARHRGTPCPDCRSTRTHAVIYEGVISLVCDTCGAVARIGRVTAP